MNHIIRYAILDPIFGSGNFVNEIIWNYGAKATQASHWFQRKHDNIFLYSKSANYTFAPPLVPYADISHSQYRYTDEDGKKYRITNRKRPDGHVDACRVYQKDGVRATDVWDIPIVGTTSTERISYPTQKPEALLERIIKASSNEGDIVLDPFVGGGTTVAVANRLGRQWIGIDQSAQAIRVSENRINNQGLTPEFEVLTSTSLSPIIEETKGAI